jgi:hypothetical protein
VSEGERASIDDLLSSPTDGAEQPASPPRPRKLRALSLVAFAAGWTTLGFVTLRLKDLTMPLPLLFAVALTFVIVWRLARGLKPAHRSRQAGRYQSEDRADTEDGLRLVINRWETLLDWSHSDVARFHRKVHPRLAELVDERLRQRHGISRAADPERARTLLGDPLWTFLTVPARRPPPPRELDVIVNALERL